MRNILLLFLFASSVCFAQKDTLGRNYYSTVLSGGFDADYRVYNSGKTRRGTPSDHFIYGLNLEANLKLYKQFFAGIGIELYQYKDIVDDRVPVSFPRKESFTGVNFYFQPSAAYNLFKGDVTLFTGLRTDLILDGRFNGYGISPFLRMQYNFPDNICVGYHFGVQKFSGNSSDGDYYGLNFVNYMYFGIKFKK